MEIAGIEDMVKDLANIIGAKSTRNKNYADFLRFKSKIINSEAKFVGILRSLFLTRLDQNNTFFELILFECLFNCNIVFSNKNRFLKPILELNGFKYKANIAFDTDANCNYITFSHDPALIRPRNYATAFSDLKKLNYLIVTKIDSWSVKTFRDSSIRSFETDLLKNVTTPKLVLADNKQIDSNQVNTPDISTVKITEENSLLNFDIDGISGIIDKNIHNCLRRPINVVFSSDVKSKICNKSRLIQMESGFCKLGSLFNIYIGNIEISSQERLEFHFIFTAQINSLSNDEIELVKIKLFDILKDEMVKLLKSDRFPTFRTTFCNVVNTDTEKGISGIIDNMAIYNILKRINAAVKTMSVFIYFEVYNCKKVFSSQEYYDILQGIDLYIDLSKIVLDLDVCTSLYLKTNPYSAIFLPNNFLDIGKFTKYTLLKNSCINNYNFKTVTLKSSKSKRILMDYCGASKVNFYSEIIRSFLPRKLSKIKFPRFTAMKMLLNFLGDQYSKNVTRKYEGYLKELSVGANNIQKFSNRSLCIRFEITTKSFNLVDYFKEIKTLILNKYYYKIETNKVLDVLKSGILGIISQMDCNPASLNLQDIARLAYNEISYFEFNVRGGKNLHILPRYLLEQASATSTEIKPFIIDKNIMIMKDDGYLIVEKLFKHCKSIIPSYREKIMQIIQFFKAIDKSPDNIGRNIVDQLVSEAAAKHRFEVNDFYSNRIAEKRYHSTPLAFSDFYTRYFENDPKSLFSIFNKIAAIHIKNYQGKTLIMASMIAAGVSKFCIENNVNRYVLRHLAYEEGLNASDLAIKIKIIGQSIVTRDGFGNSACSKLVKYSDSELILLYFAITKIYGTSSQAKIINDYKFPFYVYTDVQRLHNGSKNLKCKLEKKFTNLSEIVNRLDIFQFNIFNFIRFLNKNKRFVTSVESIKYQDELLHFAGNKKYNEKPLTFYEGLFRYQHLIPVPIEYNLTKCFDADTESLFNYLEFNPSLYGISISNTHDLTIVDNENQDIINTEDTKQLDCYDVCEFDNNNTTSYDVNLSADLVSIIPQTTESEAIQNNMIIAPYNYENASLCKQKESNEQSSDSLSKHYFLQQKKDGDYAIVFTDSDCFIMLKLIVQNVIKGTLFINRLKKLFDSNEITLFECLGKLESINLIACNRKTKRIKIDKNVEARFNQYLKDNASQDS